MVVEVSFLEVVVPCLEVEAIAFPFIEEVASSCLVEALPLVVLSLELDL